MQFIRGASLLYQDKKAYFRGDMPAGTTRIKVTLETIIFNLLAAGGIVSLILYAKCPELGSHTAREFLQKGGISLIAIGVTCNGLNILISIPVFIRKRGDQKEYANEVLEDAIETFEGKGNKNTQITKLKKALSKIDKYKSEASFIQLMGVINGALDLLEDSDEIAISQDSIEVIKTLEKHLNDCADKEFEGEFLKRPAQKSDLNKFKNRKVTQPRCVERKFFADSLVRIQTFKAKKDIEYEEDSRTVVSIRCMYYLAKHDSDPSYRKITDRIVEPDLEALFPEDSIQ